MSARKQQDLKDKSSKDKKAPSTPALDKATPKSRSYSSTQTSRVEELKSKMKGSEVKKDKSDVDTITPFDTLCLQEHDQVYCTFSKCYRVFRYDSRSQHSKTYHQDDTFTFDYLKKNTGEHIKDPKSFNKDVGEQNAEWRMKQLLQQVADVEQMITRSRKTSPLKSQPLETKQELNTVDLTQPSPLTSKSPPAIEVIQLDSGADDKIKRVDPEKKVEVSTSNVDEPKSKSIAEEVKDSQAGLPLVSQPHPDSKVHPKDDQGPKSRSKDQKEKAVPAKTVVKKQFGTQKKNEDIAQDSDQHNAEVAIKLMSSTNNELARKQRATIHSQKSQDSKNVKQEPSLPTTLQSNNATASQDVQMAGPSLIQGPPANDQLRDASKVISSKIEDEQRLKKKRSHPSQSQCNDVHEVVSSDGEEFEGCPKCGTVNEKNKVSFAFLVFMKNLFKEYQDGQYADIKPEIQQNIKEVQYLSNIVKDEIHEKKRRRKEKAKCYESLEKLVQQVERTLVDIKVGSNQREAMYLNAINTLSEVSRHVVKKEEMLLDENQQLNPRVRKIDIIKKFGKMIAKQDIDVIIRNMDMMQNLDPPMTSEQHQLFNDMRKNIQPILEKINNMKKKYQISFEAQPLETYSNHSRSHIYQQVDDSMNDENDYLRSPGYSEFDAAKYEYLERIGKLDLETIKALAQAAEQDHKSKQQLVEQHLNDDNADAHKFTTSPDRASRVALHPNKLEFNVGSATQLQPLDMKKSYVILDLEEMKDEVDGSPSSKDAIYIEDTPDRNTHSTASPKQKKSISFSPDLIIYGANKGSRSQNSSPYTNAVSKIKPKMNQDEFHIKMQPSVCEPGDDSAIKQAPLREDDQTEIEKIQEEQTSNNDLVKVQVGQLNVTDSDHFVIEHATSSDQVNTNQSQLEAKDHFKIENDEQEQKDQDAQQQLKHLTSTTLSQSEYQKKVRTFFDDNDDLASMAKDDNDVRNLNGDMNWFGEASLLEVLFNNIHEKLPTLTKLFELVEMKFSKKELMGLDPIQTIQHDHQILGQTFQLGIFVKNLLWYFGDRVYYDVEIMNQLSNASKRYTLLIPINYEPIFVQLFRNEFSFFRMKRYQGLPIPKYQCAVKMEGDRRFAFLLYGLKNFQNLQTYLSDRASALNTIGNMNLCLAILKAVAKCHKEGVCNNNLSLANIFIKMTSMKQYKVKIVDFKLFTADKRSNLSFVQPSSPFIRNYFKWMYAHAIMDNVSGPLKINHTNKFDILALVYITCILTDVRFQYLKDMHFSNQEFDLPHIFQGKFTLQISGAKIAFADTINFGLKSLSQIIDREALTQMTSLFTSDLNAFIAKNPKII